MIYSPKKNRQIKFLSNRENKAISFLRFSPNGKYLAVGEVCRITTTHENPLISCLFTHHMVRQGGNVSRYSTCTHHQHSNSAPDISRVACNPGHATRITQITNHHANCSAHSSLAQHERSSRSPLHISPSLPSSPPSLS